MRNHFQEYYFEGVVFYLFQIKSKFYLLPSEAADERYQLKINKVQKNLNQEVDFNILGRSLITKDQEKEEFKYENGFQYEGNFNFQISEDFSNTSEYYQTQNNDKLISLDLDPYFCFVLFTCLRFTGLV